MQSQNARFIEREQVGGCQEPGGGGSEELLVEGYKLTAVRGTSSGGPMYSIMAAVNNTALYTRKLLTEPISDFLNTHCMKAVTLLLTLY